MTPDFQRKYDCNPSNNDSFPFDNFDKEQLRVK